MSTKNHKTSIIAHGHAQSEDAQEFQKKPEFRKCTPNMLLVLAALDKIFVESPFLKEVLQNKAAFILASSHGEISPTLDFLKNLGAGEGARPFLFQNSLYSSTLGFLSHYYQCSGASYSVTDGENSAEAAFQLSETLLEEQGESGVEYVFVCTVDVLPSQVRASYEQLFSKCEGASVFVFSKKHKADFSITFHSVDENTKPQGNEIYLKQKYQSGALQIVSERLYESEGCFALSKENGMTSLFHVDRI